MRRVLSVVALTTVSILLSDMNEIVQAQSQNLFLSYPPKNHQTTANSIFFVGSAPIMGEVSINGQTIQRSQKGFFAPSFPLKVGTNQFTIRYQNQAITRQIVKLSPIPEFPASLGFAKNSLTPQNNIARLPNELICFEAIAPLNSIATVEIANKKIPLVPVIEKIELPPNSSILIGENNPLVRDNYSWQNLKGCTTIEEEGFIDNPVFELTMGKETVTEKSPVKVEILASNFLQVIQVIVEAGVARTGPSTNYSRLTPLPKGTKAVVTGKEGKWLRLDYGGWIKEEETQIIPDTIPPETIIRSVNSRQLENATEIVFPLQNQVPITIKQRDNTFSITLYNTTAQTDTIKFNDNPFIKRLDWEQIAPKQAEYTFTFKTEQQWGYDVRYQGTNLILILRHPPELNNEKTKSLNGISILLDPGHGGKEFGSVGPNGLPEKEVNLIMSKLLAKELTQRGASVYLTRETDQDISLGERVNLINKIKPNLAFSIHYNALPDAGSAINTQGISTFWYYPQAHDLAVFLHNYLVEKLNRPSYGVFWNNLALTRPHTAPSILLELGFMINPNEFEWIINPVEQQKLAQVIADGITTWLVSQ